MNKYTENERNENKKICMKVNIDTNLISIFHFTFISKVKYTQLVNERHGNLFF